ncbi:MAG: hypothetical protein KKG04_02540 [Candidatus Thermoplasmatota archaeon]|nr:hypothetical protein [Candidatus Thermoplasmatota archaeon]
MKIQPYLCVFMSVAMMTVVFSSVIGKQLSDNYTDKSTPLFQRMTEKASNQDSKIILISSYIGDDQDLTIPIQSNINESNFLKYFIKLAETIRKNPHLIDKLEETICLNSRDNLILNYKNDLNLSLINHEEFDELNTSFYTYYYYTCEIFCPSTFIVCWWMWFVQMFETLLDISEKIIEIMLYVLSRLFPTTGFCGLINDVYR